MTKISGTLIDGAGNALPNVQIVLTAIKTSNTVLNQTKALITTTSDAGKYNINVEIGSYAVTVLRDGFPIERVGTIEVLLNSKSGTLNDFLLLPKTGQTVTSDLLQQIIDERKLAQTAATAAKNSETNAKNTLSSAVKNSGDVINNWLSIKGLNAKLTLINPTDQKWETKINDKGDYVFSFYTGSQWIAKGCYSVENKEYRFLDTSNVTVNGKSLLKSGDGGLLSYTSNVSDMFSADIKTGFYRYDPSSINTPVANSYGYINKIAWNEKESKMMVYQFNSHRTFSGFKDKTTGKISFVEFINTSNISNYALLKTGGTVTGKTNFTINPTINTVPILKQGDGGLLSYPSYVDDMFSSDTKTGFYRYLPSSTNTPISNSYGYVNKISWNANESRVIAYHINSHRTFTGFKDKNTGKISFAEFITKSNSTVDSNGFLKAASPILRLYAEQPESADSFTQAGYGLVNSDAKGVCAKKIGIGHYEIHGSLGFAKEGWYIEQPKDANGNVFSFLEYSTDENNVITVKTYTKKFDFETCNIVAGEPADIKEGRWIDLRLEMPIIETVEQIEPIPSLLNPII